MFASSWRHKLKENGHEPSRPITSTDPRDEEKIMRASVTLIWDLARYLSPVKHPWLYRTKVRNPFRMFEALNPYKWDNMIQPFCRRRAPRKLLNQVS
ncbi:hypothetical protein AnigIFM60653_009478 [Aspergillus niger]|nr:hypothetical protein AnigIFM50267_010822 [Aspergillus niger]GLA07958.1 hypothetical protein AnigIFM60653_009478 [Aspergillus niger]